jgi:hypothetical protein
MVRLLRMLILECFTSKEEAETKFRLSDEDVRIANEQQHPQSINANLSKTFIRY